MDALLHYLTNAQDSAQSGWLGAACGFAGRAERAAENVGGEIQDRVNAYGRELRRQHYDQATATIDHPTLRTAYLAALGAIHVSQQVEA